MSHITYIVGARPNFMKIGSVVDAVNQAARGVSQRIIHTGQHYSPEMSDLFFSQLKLPAPDVNLDIRSGSHGAQTGRMLEALETEFAANRPAMLVVVGDVNSTLAAAIAASKLGIPIAHVESGLRSGDLGMPEEINRILTDAIANLHFVTEESGLINLGREGRDPAGVHFVGNTMIDSLIRHKPTAEQATILNDLQITAHAGKYALITMHRPSNVDDPAVLSGLVDMLVTLADTTPLVFPMHPRTRARMVDAGGFAKLSEHPHVRVCDPLGYLEFMKLMMHAKMVVTDSGGIQEETTWLGVPCITMRDTTERPITIRLGTNQLVGTDPGDILRAALAAQTTRSASRDIPPMWDGRAGERIAKVILDRIT